MIRDATSDDMSEVSELYNALVATTTVAWTETPEALTDRIDWFGRQRDRGWPVLVAEDAGEIVGFTAYESFRGDGKWPGYRYTVEHTIHVRGDQWGRGIGRGLLTELMERARRAGMHAMVGAVDGANRDSIAFHRRLGFVEVARMPEVGRKFDRWLDLVLMQRILDEPSA